MPRDEFQPIHPWEAALWLGQGMEIIAVYTLFGLDQQGNAQNEPMLTTITTHRQLKTLADFQTNEQIGGVSYKARDCS